MSIRFHRKLQIHGQAKKKTETHMCRSENYEQEMLIDIRTKRVCLCQIDCMNGI